MYLIPSLFKEVSDAGLHKLKKAHLIEGLGECGRKVAAAAEVKAKDEKEIERLKKELSECKFELENSVNFTRLLQNTCEDLKKENTLAYEKLDKVADLKNEWFNKYHKLKYKYEGEVTGKKVQFLADKLTKSQVDKKTIFEKAGDKLFKFSKKRGSFATILLLISIVLLYVTIAMHITEGVELGLSYFFSSTALIIWIKKLVAVVLLSLASLFLIKINYPGLD